MSAEHPEVVWCVEYHLDTVMWNEGFDLADLPWCRFYTDNSEFVSQLSDSVHISLPTDDWGADFSIKRYQTIMQDDDEAGTHLEGVSDDEREYEQDRYLGFVTGTPDDILDLVVDRVLKWEGV